MAVASFRDKLADVGIPKITDIEFYIRSSLSKPKLDGTGMVVVNPPYQLENKLRIMLPVLSKFFLRALMHADRLSGWTEKQWLPA